MHRALVAPIAASLVAASPLAAGRAQAAPITYTETTVASGVLGAETFMDSPLTLSFTGDTVGVVSPVPGFFANVDGIASFDVAGIGAGTFNGGTPAALAYQSLSAAGIGATSTDLTVGQNGQTNILITGGAAFATYDLTGAIGPIVGPAVFPEGLAFSTTVGDFSLTSAGDVTFTAIEGPTAVHEPASLAILGIGLFGLSLIQLRRTAACDAVPARVRPAARTAEVLDSEPVRAG